MPKFKVGDTIVHKDDKHLSLKEMKREYIILKIIGREKPNYLVENFRIQSQQWKEDFKYIDAEWTTLKYMQSPLWKKLEGNNG